ncbi:hypothetical protein [Nocardia bovistercoris]|uniref:Uncharacterized protein n=1 Tax=Nocardia bovistercoris TaxID=2785916 RepID=A0A931I9E3_9NOCA|nr:hypothetical protein [Nocardia bovistercoris]MBH0777284.1 hypothetical protein [Nocardia bovistercoris]
MTNALSEMDQINAELMSSGTRNPFGRDIEPGTMVSGEIVAVIRRHRHNSQGQPLFWVNRKPMVAAAGDPVIDSALVIQVEEQERDTPDEEGLRLITLDRDIQRAISAGVRRSSASGLAIGGCLDGLAYVGPAAGSGYGRVYEMRAYVPPAE